MSKQEVATSEIKADVGDLEMGKSGPDSAKADCTIFEHTIPFNEMEKELRTDFAKGLTTEGTHFFISWFITDLERPPQE
jgi:hypothetical protein